MTTALADRTGPAGTRAKAGPREWTGLCVLLLPLLLVSMDVSVLYFAVPFISRDLQPSGAQQLWIFDVYGFVLAGLLITMGSLGDRIGRRRLLLTGALAFSLASLGAAYSHSAAELITARAVQGVAGATLMPSTLALIRNMFHDEKQRRTAVAVWTSATMSGIALGPVLSGFLVEHFWWGSVFLINVPFMVMLLALAPALVPEFRAPQPGRFDLLSVLLSLGAVLPVIYGMQQIAAAGVDAARVAAIAGGTVAGIVFVARQARSRAPMIDLRLFRSRGFTGAVVLNLVSMFAVVGFAIFATQYLQSVRDMSPFAAALWSLVPMSGTAAAVPLSQLLVKRVDRAYVAAGGLLVAAGGYAVPHPGTGTLIAVDRAARREHLCRRRGRRDDRRQRAHPGCGAARGPARRPPWWRPPRSSAARSAWRYSAASASPCTGLTWHIPRPPGSRIRLWPRRVTPSAARSAWPASCPRGWASSSRRPREPRSRTAWTPLPPGRASQWSWLPC